MDNFLKFGLLLVATFGAVLVSAKVVPLKNGDLTVSRDYSVNLAGSETLDQNGQYQVSWTVNETGKSIHFEITANTTGYIGFGFSPTGGMGGADLLIAGVQADGTKYAFDYHGVGNTAPVLDTQQDYILDDATETETSTTLKFHRLLNTCDKEDFQITDETMKLIWSMGENDDIDYHGRESRGTKSVNFYLGEEEFQPDDFEKFDFLKTTPLPAEHTSYWCSIHELPRFTDPQHIVAFEPVLNSSDAIQHTHHFILYRCQAPEGQDADELFKPWVDHQGDYCYEQSIQDFPFNKYCNGNQVYVWSKGGKRMVFPPDLGLPMPDVFNKTEYYAMEIHYDNPGKLENKNFTTGARMYYTDKLRPTEAGLMVVTHSTSVQLTIPPQAPNYVVVGHCSSECTNELLPENGVTVFNNLLHAHLAGRKIKLRQFRDTEELQWLDNDDYYDFDFQQNKPLKTYRKIERGDHLTVECTFDSTKVNGSKAVIGGLSSSEEMCQAWMFYYPRLKEFSRCGSSQNLERHMNLLGITKWEKGEPNFPGGQEAYVVLEPAKLKGDYVNSISYNVSWTDEFRAKFQEEKRYGLHEGSCRGGRGELFQIMEVKYPENVKEYVPVNTCETKPPCEGSNCSGGHALAAAKLLYIFCIVAMLVV